jgi:flavin-dependent dehydrogenase
MHGQADLIVVGAGVAGTAAAIQGARLGLEVVLLEGATAPRTVPGESLHPGIEPIFDQLGVGSKFRAAGFKRHHGVWVSWDGARRFEAFGGDEGGPWLGFQADRARLAEILHEEAVVRGAKLQRGVAVLSPVVRDDRVVGVETSAGHMLARHEAVGSPPVRVKFGWRPGCADGDPEFRATPDGWFWASPIGGGRTAWAEAVIGQTGGGIDLSWRLRTSSVVGTLLVGDAAVTMDPSSSHGVLRAAMTGMLAAQTIDAAVSGQAEDRQAIESYRQWVSKWFYDDVERLTRIYQAHPSHAIRQLFKAASAA